ncbi:hypothetical protein ACWEN6_13780 [Sphaerisporangium sp. NPDC004334]
MITQRLVQPKRGYPDHRSIAVWWGQHGTFAGHCYDHPAGRPVEIFTIGAHNKEFPTMPHFERALAEHDVTLPLDVVEALLNDQAGNHA